LARHERDFRAAAEEPFGADELRALLGGRGKGLTRRHAMACYLSASDGWLVAGELLGGAFAEDGPELRERKAD
jgi:hypothetical protein